MNECLLNPCHINADCNNTDGGFYYYCQSGYLGDGFQCTGANNMPKKLLGMVYIHSEFFELQTLTSVCWRSLCVMLMLSVRITKVASPAHVQRAMREMESTVAEVHI